MQVCVMAGGRAIARQDTPDALREKCKEVFRVMRAPAMLQPAADASAMAQRIVEDLARRVNGKVANPEDPSLVPPRPTESQQEFEVRFLTLEICCTLRCNFYSDECVQLRRSRVGRNRPGVSRGTAVSLRSTLALAGPDPFRARARPRAGVSRRDRDHEANGDSWPFPRGQVQVRDLRDSRALLGAVQDDPAGLRSPARRSFDLGTQLHDAGPGLKHGRQALRRLQYRCAA